MTHGQWIRETDHMKLKMHSYTFFFYPKFQLMELTHMGCVSGTGHRALLELCAEEDEVNA